MSVMNRYRSSPEVAFGDVHYPPGGKFGPRIQQHYQLVVMNSGEANIEVDGQEMFVPEHHAVLLLPNRREMFYFTRSHPTHHTFCEIAPHYVPPAILETVGQRTICLPLTERILKAVDFGLSVPSSPLVSTDDLIRAAGIMTFQVFMFEAELVHCPATQPEAVRRALAFMDEHLGEPLTLSTLADAVAMSPQHLTRLFRQHLHTTPMRYLWQLRTRHGVEMLGPTGRSIPEIAVQVGFQSLFHFSRMVTQYYHTSPSRLRQRMWSGTLMSSE
jgi:AraC-like DNA-binding protein